MCLPDLDHNWPRYVMPAGTTLSPSDGFLPDPDGRFERYSNPGLLTVGEFFIRRCCVLLGDAGIGKSDVLLKEHARVLSHAQQPGNVIFRSLRDFGSDVTAEQFLGSPEITAWISDDTAELFLFLDSLDEALLKVDTWASLLSKALARWPLTRLWLRLTCRPGFWPASLSLALTRGFGDGFSRGNLAPLRQRDIESAASQHNIPPEQLLEEIRRANATTFAARPLTLKMIFGIFAEHSRLPASHAEMYEQGCQYLASEHNAAVLEGHRLTNVPIQKRMAIVERIAAMSVFCDRRFIQHPNAADLNLPEGTLSASEICSNDVAPAELREVLACALFSFENPDALVWTNWSYAEFLAASWCVSQQLTTVGIKNLISVVGDSGAGVPQQLSSTAIWICELRRELQIFLVELNPSLLLFIDEGAVNTSILPRLVKQSVERRTTWELARQVPSYAHRFKYPGIGRQLSRYLRRPHRDWECATAVQIATACELSELSDAFVAIAENDRLSLDLRQLAAAAIAQTGTEDARRAILHFATNPAPEDVNDNLKGCALLANWPAQFGLIEVMPLLTRPRNPNHAGYYEAFLVNFANSLDTNLPEGGLLTVMRWAQQEWLAGGRNAYFDPIVDSVMRAAWENIQNDAVREAFAATLLSRLRNHVPGFPGEIGFRSRDVWQERLSQSDGRRTLLLQSAIILAPESPYVMGQVCSALLASPADAGLLLQMAREGTELTRRKISTIFFMLDRGDPDTLTAIYGGVQEGVIDAPLRSLLSVDRDSEAAQQLRDEFGREARQQLARQNTIDTRLRDLNRLLGRSEDGEPDAWFAIWDTVLMARWPSVSAWGGAARLDQLGCWTYFDDPTRTRIYLAAERCLLTGTRPAMDFIGQNAWPSWASAEFSALLNTLERAPGVLLAADDEAWQRWSTLALWHTFTGVQERDREFRAFLAQRLRSFLAAADEVLNIYIQNRQCYSVVDGLRFTWPSEMARFLVDRTRRIELTNLCWDSLCALGMAEAPELFEDYLWKEFDRLGDLAGEGRDERLITTVALLLRRARPGTWTALSELIFSEPSLGREAVARAGDVSQRNNWTAEMTDGEVAELYIWMSRQFPADIGFVRGATSFTGPVAIRMLRDSALVGMRSRGNLEVFRSVLAALPDVAWLPAQIAYVEEAHFRRRWKVETPEGLLQMAAENRVPWYEKERYQIILLVIAMLSLALGVASLVAANGAWRIIAVIVSSVVFLTIVAALLRLRVHERRPKP
jgi:hypothetical protein